ncbi:MAG: phosphatidylserine decarboxylase family protein [Candidatus Cloacimonadota bacterium]|nr:MAG: phosphatidylserine decarboxylase family protein [Candidatus Cloacimonadota bacterium]
MLISKDHNVVKAILPVLIAILFILLLLFIVNKIVYSHKIISCVFYVFCVLLLFSLFFFRDPERNICQNEKMILSPADGKVIKIENVFNGFFNKELSRISIFMSLFNVHINRAPINGKIEFYEYKKGKFFNASFDKASEENEQNFFVLKNDKIQIGVKQIAGIIARRIVFWKELYSELDKGEKFGLIRYGSRLEVYLPKTVEIKVKIGEKVKAGESIIGEIKQNE